jgi:MYXO-CTERM domain-containing protein
MARRWFPLFLMAPVLVWSDVALADVPPPDDGEGCECSAASPASAAAPGLLLALALWSRRRR